MGLSLAVFVAAWLVLALSGPARTHLWGDEGTYTAMTASLVRDGDLVFSDSDLDWVIERQPDSPVTVILQKSTLGITYSKPLLYSVLAVPLFAFVGEPGLIATNLFLLIVALILTWGFLRPVATAERLFWTLLTVAGASVLLVYVGWKMSDLALAALTLAGLVLSLGGRKIDRSGHRISLPYGNRVAALAGGALLGAAISMRFSSAALAAAVVLALAVDRRWRRAFLVAAAVGTTLLAVCGVSYKLLGTANPYKTVRSSFNQTTGYPVGDRADEAGQRFIEGRATQSAGWLPPGKRQETFYSTFYFFVGRHTGLLAYFPIALVLLFHLIRRPDRVSSTLLAGAVVVVAFYLVWMPENYFGGSTFVGNRYFLGVFPVFLAALSRLPSTRSLLIAWTLALISWASAVYSTTTVAGLDASSQTHAHAGIFRWLPFESTARRIDGLTERFWAEDYVRFLDPFVRTARWSFRLDSNRPPAEVLVATAWPGETLQFVVSPRAARVKLEVAEGQRRTGFVIPRQPPSPPGLIQVPTSGTWRRHPFWWKKGRLYNIRILRFSLSTENGEPTTAVVRYAGRGRVLAPLSAELLGLEPSLPSRIGAGETTRTLVRARNTGQRPWRVEGLFPVRLGYRFLQDPGSTTRATDSLALSHNVPPRKELSERLALRWPDEPGRYRLIIELQRLPAARLGEPGRTTLVTREVEVGRAVNPDSQEP